MNLKKILDLMPELERLTPELINEISFSKRGINLNFNKTWEDNGYDDLDLIELLMEIENELNISFPDYIAEVLFNGSVKPPIFISVIRDRKLDQLGIPK
jgi:acyl carrier protein